MVFTRVFHFAKDLRCFANWVCGCANCVYCFEKQNKTIKIVLKQSRKTVNLFGVSTIKLSCVCALDGCV